MKQGFYGTTQNVDSVRYHFQLTQSPKPVSEEESQNEVVVESGPVEYEKNDENTQEYDELEEEEGEEGEPVSVAQLMGHIYDGGNLLPFFFSKESVKVGTHKATSCSNTSRRRSCPFRKRSLRRRDVLLQLVARLAQLDKRRSAEREAAGSSPCQTNMHSGSLNN